MHTLNITAMTITATTAPTIISLKLCFKLFYFLLRTVHVILEYLFPEGATRITKTDLSRLQRTKNTVIINLT